MVRLYDAADIERLRESGRILAHVLATLREMARPGIPLAALNRAAERLIHKAGAQATFLGYRQEGARKPYPASICTSLNATVVHGIPSGYALKEGDVLKIDLGIDFKGYITDAAVTVGIGAVPERERELIAVTDAALEAAIKICFPGKHLGDIGHAIETTAEKAGFSVIRGLTGHGVGFALHEEPIVFNYGAPGTGLSLEPGLVLALEPMVSAGSGEIEEKKDGSFRTKDGSITAHAEHTVAVTEDGPEVLTE